MGEGEKERAAQAARRSRFIESLFQTLSDPTLGFDLGEKSTSDSSAAELTARLKNLLTEMEQKENELTRLCEKSFYYEDSPEGASKQEALRKLAGEIENINAGLAKQAPFAASLVNDIFLFLKQDAEYVRWLFNLKRKNENVDMLGLLHEWHENQLRTLYGLYEHKKSFFPNPQTNDMHKRMHEKLSALHVAQQTELVRFFSYRYREIQRGLSQTTAQANRDYRRLSEERGAHLESPTQSSRRAKKSIEAEETRRQLREKAIFEANMSPFVVRGFSKFPLMNEVIPNVPTTTEGVKALLSDFLVCESRYPGIGLNIRHFDKKNRKYVFFKAVEMGINPDWIHGYEMTEADRRNIEKHYLGKMPGSTSQDRHDRLEEVRTRASIESTKTGNILVAQQMLYPENFVNYSLEDQKKFFCDAANTFQRARLLMSPYLSSELKSALMNGLSQEAAMALFDSVNAESGVGKEDMRISPLALGRLFGLLGREEKGYRKMRKMKVFRALSPETQKQIYDYAMPEVQKKLERRKVKTEKTLQVATLTQDIINLVGVGSKKENLAIVSKLPQKFQNWDLLTPILKFNSKQPNRIETIKTLFEKLEKQEASKIAAGLLLTLQRHPEEIIPLLTDLENKLGNDNYAAILKSLGPDLAVSLIQYDGKGTLDDNEKIKLFWQLSPVQRSAVFLSSDRKIKSLITVEEVMLREAECVEMLNYPGVARKINWGGLAKDKKAEILSLLNSPGLDLLAKAEVLEKLLWATRDGGDKAGDIKALIKEYVEAHQNEPAFLAYLMNTLSSEVFHKEKNDKPDYPFLFAFLSKAQRGAVLGYLRDPILIEYLRKTYKCEQAVAAALPGMLAPAPAVVAVAMPVPAPEPVVAADAPVVVAPAVAAAKDDVTPVVAAVSAAPAAVTLPAVAATPDSIPTAAKAAEPAAVKADAAAPADAAPRRGPPPPPLSSLHLLSDKGADATEASAATTPAPVPTALVKADAAAHAAATPTPAATSTTKTPTSTPTPAKTSPPPALASLSPTPPLARPAAAASSASPIPLTRSLPAKPGQPTHKASAAEEEKRRQRAERIKELQEKVDDGKASIQEKSEMRKLIEEVNAEKRDKGDAAAAGSSEELVKSPDHFEQERKIQARVILNIQEALSKKVESMLKTVRNNDDGFVKAAYNLLVAIRDDRSSDRREICSVLMNEIDKADAAMKVVGDTAEDRLRKEIIARVAADLTMCVNNLSALSPGNERAGRALFNSLEGLERTLNDYQALEGKVTLLREHLLAERANLMAYQQGKFEREEVIRAFIPLLEPYFVLKVKEAQLKAQAEEEAKSDPKYQALLREIEDKGLVVAEAEAKVKAALAVYLREKPIIDRECEEIVERHKAAGTNPPTRLSVHQSKASFKAWGRAKAAVELPKKQKAQAEDKAQGWLKDRVREKLQASDETLQKLKELEAAEKAVLEKMTDVMGHLSGEELEKAQKLIKEVDDRVKVVTERSFAPKALVKPHYAFKKREDFIGYIEEEVEKAATSSTGEVDAAAFHKIWEKFFGKEVFNNPTLFRFPEVEVLEALRAPNTELLQSAQERVAYYQARTETGAASAELEKAQAVLRDIEARIEDEKRVAAEEAAKRAVSVAAASDAVPTDVRSALLAGFRFRGPAAEGGEPAPAPALASAARRASPPALTSAPKSDSAPTAPAPSAPWVLPANAAPKRGPALPPREVVDKILMGAPPEVPASVPAAAPAPAPAAPRVSPPPLAAAVTAKPAPALSEDSHAKLMRSIVDGGVGSLKETGGADALAKRDEDRKEEERKLLRKGADEAAQRRREQEEADRKLHEEREELERARKATEEAAERARIEAEAAARKSAEEAAEKAAEKAKAEAEAARKAAEEKARAEAVAAAAERAKLEVARKRVEAASTKANSELEKIALLKRRVVDLAAGAAANVAEARKIAQAENSIALSLKEQIAGAISAEKKVQAFLEKVTSAAEAVSVAAGAAKAAWEDASTAPTETAINHAAEAAEASKTAAESAADEVLAEYTAVTEAAKIVEEAKKAVEAKKKEKEEIERAKQARKDRDLTAQREAEAQKARETLERARAQERAREAARQASAAEVATKAALAAAEVLRQQQEAQAQARKMEEARAAAQAVAKKAAEAAAVNKAIEADDFKQLAEAATTQALKQGAKPGKIIEEAEKAETAAKQAEAAADIAEKKAGEAGNTGTAREAAIKAKQSAREAREAANMAGEMAQEIERAEKERERADREARAAKEREASAALQEKELAERALAESARVVNEVSARRTREEQQEQMRAAHLRESQAILDEQLHKIKESEAKAVREKEEAAKRQFLEEEAAQKRAQVQHQRTQESQATWRLRYEAAAILQDEVAQRRAKETMLAEEQAVDAQITDLTEKKRRAGLVLGRPGMKQVEIQANKVRVQSLEKKIQELKLILNAMRYEHEQVEAGWKKARSRAVPITKIPPGEIASSSVPPPVSQVPLSKMAARQIGHAVQLNRRPPARKGP